MRGLVGFFTNTVYLLVAGMLISPLAGPAMNFAMATARGDLGQLARSVGRYVAALATGATVAALLTLAFGLSIATTLMTDLSSISVAAVVLALIAGGAGALTLVQSERSSLVSGAATGMLVAAALAPPMGLLGMAVVLRVWELVASAGFLLGLQLVGINLAGSLVFRLAGVGPEGVRYPRGRERIRTGATLLTLAAIGGFLAWQFLTVPSLQRETLARTAETAALEALDASDRVEPVEVTARYTRADITGQNTILVQAFVQVGEGVTPSPELERALTRAVESEVDAAVANTVPLVNVVLLEPR